MISSASEASRAWWWAVAALVGVRVLIPVAALADEGKALPGLPAYDYGPFYGDANGFYATARELVSAAGRTALPLLLVLVVGGACSVLALRRPRMAPWVALVVAGATISASLTVIVLEMQPSGSAAIGWPFFWAIPLAPLRAVHALGPDSAFAVGLALSLAAIGSTVVVTALAGFWASGRRAVGLVAAALFAVWPFVPGLVVGARGWENGTWNVDVGLHLYAEPLSTALVVGAVALLIRRHGSDLAVAAAGLALGFGTVVKLTNAAIAVVLVFVVASFRGRRSATLLAGACLAFAPVLIAYWAQGYASSYDGAISTENDVWSLGHIRTTWSESLLFTPTLVLLLAPLAVVGAIVLRNRYATALIVAPIVVTVVVYSVYTFTPLHPRFFYVVLPLVLVLDAAGAVAIASWVAGRRRGERSHSVSESGDVSAGG